jgi:hypothetical protein
MEAEGCLPERPADNRNVAKPCLSFCFVFVYFRSVPETHSRLTLALVSSSRDPPAWSMIAQLITLSWL